MALIDARRNRFFPAALALFAIATLSPHVHGQNVSLPADITSKTGLSPDDTTAINTFVSAYAPALSGSDPSKVHDAMDALRAPFTAQSIQDMSVLFRRRYSDALVPTLSSMLSPAEVANPASDLPIRALSMAGELGTKDAADLLTKVIAAPRADVRYQAAYGLRRTFFMIHNSKKASLMLPDEVAGLIRTVGDRAAVEKDPLVLDGLVRALTEAGKYDPQLPEVIRVMGEAISTNIKDSRPSTQPAEAAALVRAATGMIDLLSTPNVAIPADNARSGAKMGGQLAAYAARAVNDKAVSVGGNDELRGAIADLATASQNAVLVAYPRLNVGQQAPKAAPLGNTLRAGTVANDAQFVIDVGAFVNDVLAKPPYGFDARSFQLK